MFLFYCGLPYRPIKVYLKGFFLILGQLLQIQREVDRTRVNIANMMIVSFIFFRAVYGRREGEGVGGGGSWTIPHSFLPRSFYCYMYIHAFGSQLRCIFITFLGAVQLLFFSSLLWEHY